ncbi:D-tyrosyl-tRNA(Tyr) deacylase [Pelobium manganitolerans]|uniref:D-aminoacyl-tRNA deacylase n=1 Tax=Pelobium manganitolerans TaxID=1842495 RepID=A0A419S6X0_9SPHI|nr:D-aminoacyl-tRNA deacylase [Pelobium manganitolerans]RKD17092.1 D-tyrosyl-tRNA(Tyr) deacylase [Pelobium manganitolerans]
MRAVIQRVSEAKCTVNGEISGQIKHGFLVLLGIANDDDQSDLDWLMQKIVNLRVFSDEAGLMNKSVLDVGGNILLISQFTLFAQTKKGNRPSFINAAKPDIAVPLYQKAIAILEQHLNRKIATGIFGADMKISLVNDGPVTITIDTKNKE